MAERVKGESLRAQAKQSSLLLNCHPEALAERSPKNSSWFFASLRMTNFIPPHLAKESRMLYEQRKIYTNINPQKRFL